jgi:hypothetical protein
MTCVGEKSFAPLAQHTAPVLFSSLKQKELDNSNTSMSSARDEEHQKRITVNRRRLVRLPPPPGLSCSIVGDGDSVGTLAEVIDLWQSGAYLFTRRRCELGSHLHITLSNAAELFRHSAIIVVRLAAMTSDGTHMECEFLQEMAHDHLRALLWAPYVRLPRSR